MSMRRREETGQQPSGSVEAADDFWKDPAQMEAYAALITGTEGASLIERLAEWLPPQAAVLELGIGTGKEKRYKRGSAV
ncbi:MAG: hypothetical protein OXF83_05670 [Anaerolineaceae bacterium]|nr:hypothetical protein [Anaerolineaceae bacterium]